MHLHYTVSYEHYTRVLLYSIYRYHILKDIAISVDHIHFFLQMSRFVRFCHSSYVNAGKT